MSEQTNAAPAKKPRGRSPSYPAVDLSTAIQRTQKLWAEERQHPASLDTISRHWGYKSLNGPASATLAALKKFGLVQDEGSGAARRARVSDLAVEIMANPDEEARLKAIQRAALNPAIHRDLWEKYGATPPSDANLRWELTRDRAFTETGADEFIPEYRATVTFAQLTDGATVTTQAPQDRQVDDDEGDTTQLSPDGSATRRRPTRTRRMSDDATTYAVPVATGSDVVIEGRFPLSEREWNQFMTVLTAMKPALVTGTQAEQTDGR